MKTLMDHNMDNALDLLKIELPDKNVMRFVSDRADTVYQCEVHTSVRLNGFSHRMDSKRNLP